MWQNVMNFVFKTSNKGSPQMKTSKIIKVAHQIRKQPWEKFPKLIIVGVTTIRQVRVGRYMFKYQHMSTIGSQVGSQNREKMV